MRAYRALVVFGLLLLTALAAACVELDGQRITFRFDAARDELQILIQYDGIHDSLSPRHGQGADQVPQFVADGDVMLLDWPFHYRAAEMRRTAADASRENEPEGQLARALVAHLRVQQLGHYRDPDGRVGVAQLVTVVRAREFVYRINTLLNLHFRRDGAVDAATWPRTQALTRGAARKGFEWLALAGHSIRFTLPVGMDEWDRMKAQLLGNLLAEIRPSVAPGAAQGEADARRARSAQKRPAFLAQAIAGLPLSIDEERDESRVTIRLGNPKAPTTLRWRLRDEYEPSLEAAVTQAVPAALDRELADRLLATRRSEETTVYETILGWCPPEEKVRALLGATAAGDLTRRRAALAQLDDFGRQWTMSHGWPAAPTAVMDDAAAVAQWQDWYRRMLAFPGKE